MNTQSNLPAAAASTATASPLPAASPDAGAIDIFDRTVAALNAATTPEAREAVWQTFEREAAEYKARREPQAVS